MNTVQLVGRLTKDIEVKYTPSGVAVGSFTLAVNRSFTNQQGEREADFIMCQIWRKAAENLAKFTRKGSQIGIEGRIQTRNYENQQGQKVYVTEVVVNNFHLLEYRRENNENQAQNQSGATQNGQEYNYANNKNNAQNSVNFNEFEAAPIELNEEDLPF